MDLQEAQAFFLQYNGLEFHMFHDDPRRYRAFQALEDARLIRREGKSMYVLDPAGLEGVL